MLPAEQFIWEEQRIAVWDASVINHKQPKVKERNCLTEESDSSGGLLSVKSPGTPWWSSG